MHSPFAFTAFFLVTGISGCIAVGAHHCLYRNWNKYGNRPFSFISRPLRALVMNNSTRDLQLNSNKTSNMTNESFLKTDTGQIVITILSQENSFHSTIAQKLKDNILNQAAKIQKIPYIYIVPRDLNYVGAWTVIPILPHLKKLHGKNASWFYFCEDLTVINFKNLLNGLGKYNSKKDVWIGYALFDQEPSIIHHFAFAENPKFFKYPLFRAGFAMTSTFLHKLSLENKIKSEFSIDPSHELAMAVGINNPLKNDSNLFCSKKSKGCGSYPSPHKTCDNRISKNNIFFAVKTYHKYHKDRVKVVKQTWGKEANYIEFFSDIYDKNIPTTDVGVNNTERGHCAKTMKILDIVLNRILNELNDIMWVVLVDDDTIIGVDRLLSLISCFPTDVVIGERYGYNVRSSMGYNYPTGGGGIVLGIDILADLVKHCHCPANDSPDDMVLGMCLSSLGVPLIHSPLFHQARPEDYAESLLEVEKPISFHKHWNLDPFMVYNEWFKESKNDFIRSEL